jgi:hypothetical protein
LILFERQLLAQLLEPSALFVFLDPLEGHVAVVPVLAILLCQVLRDSQLLRDVSVLQDSSLLS